MFLGLMSSQCLLEGSWCKSDWTPLKGNERSCVWLILQVYLFVSPCPICHAFGQSNCQVWFFSVAFKEKTTKKESLLLVLCNVPLILLLWQITSVLAWRPHLQSQKWLSCSVQSLEMFSCVLSCEDETALSIIDPTSALVELNNARRQKGRKNAGLLGIAEEQLPSLEVTKVFSSHSRELQGHNGICHPKFRLIFDIY